MQNIDDEVRKRKQYAVPEFMHPDKPRGPAVTAVDRQALLTALAAKLQARQVDVVRCCYSVAVDGLWWNLDPETGRILFGLPWTTFSHAEWGLTRSECDVMRLCIRHFRKACAGPFFYDKRVTRWFVDIKRYPTLEALYAVPDAWIITPTLVAAADNHRRGLPYQGHDQG